LVNRNIYNFAHERKHIFMQALQF